jgi:hypothetical protein
MFASVHEKEITSHFQSLSLEEILGTGFKSIFSSDNLPDTPFPNLYRTVNFYKVSKDIEKAKEKLKDFFSANEIVSEPYFGLASLPAQEGIYGYKEMLEILDPQNVINVRKKVAK